MSSIFLLMAVLASAMFAQAAKQHESSIAGANPIRKVVTMLQAMQKKVEAEGDKEEGLYKKFMCYCETGGGSLEKSIADAGTKLTDLGSEIEAAEAKHAELKEDLKKHRADRDAAKTSMADATAVREKEAAKFATEKSDLDTNIAALSKAITAVSGGISGSFIQTRGAQVLRNMVSNKQDMDDDDRQTLLSFLSGSQASSYSPKSGEILGILKQIGDEFQKSLASATDAETAAIASYDDLMAAKTKEVAACTEAIEVKTARVGELAVEIVQMKNDLSETEEALMEDKKFLANLEKECKTKTAEWEERQKTRSEELLALADTIKILNDDDALELFKKTLPSSSASFVQVQVSSDAARSRALSMLHNYRVGRPSRVNVDFITLALQGKKIGFEKVVKMIDDMVTILKKEQQDDDHKKEDCEKQLDLADDKKKGVEHHIADLEIVIADLEESIGTTTSEIAALEDGIKTLDKLVADATEQRKEEHEEYTELMASDTAAKELLGIAKNRLNKFYNPSLYKAPPKRVLTEEERLYVASGGTLDATPAPGGIAGTGVTVMAQVQAHMQSKADPGPAPETFSGAYKKKSAESTGVIAMVDLLIKDLDKEMTEAEAEEQNAQKDYETAMADAKDKRTTDSKLLTEKGAAKAGMEKDLVDSKDSLASGKKELQATLEYIASLHADCDFLLKYYSVRKEARSSEIDSLSKAKAVLSGADFSLLQQGKSAHFLRKHQ